MMIKDLTIEMMDEAKKLVWLNYEEARKNHWMLPGDCEIPEMNGLFQNGLGAAAFEGGKMIGFLSGYGPWGPVFTTKDTMGVYSPLHAHAAIEENRKEIYQRLYEAAGEKWVKVGAASHTITLYDPDEGAEDAFFEYGFGKRCVDLMRKNEPDEVLVDGVEFEELPKERVSEIRHLRFLLCDHLAKSPCHMKLSDEQNENWIRNRESNPPRVFIAKKDGKIAAFMDVQEDGENFIADHASVMNICGAYCLKEYRGEGIAPALLGYVGKTLKAEGVLRIGVDCESFNPTAIRFWKKHFSPYTQSLVRRIDENAIG